MSTRNDIIDKVKVSSASYGLVYTCRCGWIDLGHANPKGKGIEGAENLWRIIVAEIGIPSKDGRGFKVSYSQSNTKRGFTDDVKRHYYVKYGLTRMEKESVALAIFMEVSYAFESLQSRVYYRPFTDSGFSSEDLVSDLLAFIVQLDPVLITSKSANRYQKKHQKKFGMHTVLLEQ